MAVSTVKIVTINICNIQLEANLNLLRQFVCNSQPDIVFLQAVSVARVEPPGFDEEVGRAAREVFFSEDIAPLLFDANDMIILGGDLNCTMKKAETMYRPCNTCSGFEPC